MVPLETGPGVLGLSSIPRYDQIMADDLLSVLTRFHREVMLPDVRQTVEESEGRIRDEMLSLFDGVFQRLERLDVEYHAIAAAVARIERHAGPAGSEEEKASIQKQIQNLRVKVADLQQRLDEIESAS